MIESTIITWIGTGTTAGSRVSVGSRLQSTELPALVVEIPSGQTVAIGNGLATYDVIVRAVAETMLDAQSLSAAAVSAIKSSAATASKAVVENQFAAIEEPVVGEGDEIEPAICTAFMTVYY